MSQNQEYNLNEAENDINFVCINEKSKKFIYKNADDEFETVGIGKFVDKFNKNKLKPHLKSEIEPKDNKKKLIKVLVGKNFEKMTTKKKEDSLILVYKNDCPECVEFEPVYTQLAKHYLNDKGIKFMKIDKSKNDIPEDYETTVCPALFFAKPKSKPVLFDYKKDAKLDDLIKFVNENKSSDNKHIKEDL